MQRKVHISGKGGEVGGGAVEKTCFLSVLHNRFFSMPVFQIYLLFHCFKLLQLLIFITLVLHGAWVNPVWLGLQYFLNSLKKVLFVFSFWEYRFFNRFSWDFDFKDKVLYRLQNSNINTFSKCTCQTVQTTKDKHWLHWPNGLFGN